MKFDREYRYDMGFVANGKPLPDPSKFGATENSLDTSAERDATGYLHRAMVATKHTYSLGWKNITWDMTKQILNAVVGESFMFKCPDPSTGGIRESKCYAGDRKYDCVWYPDGEDSVGNLSFNVIEY